jgi:hypothetical protein
MLLAGNHGAFRFFNLSAMTNVCGCFKLQALLERLLSKTTKDIILQFRFYRPSLLLSKSAQMDDFLEYQYAGAIR